MTKQVILGEVPSVTRWAKRCFLDCAKDAPALLIDTSGAVTRSSLEDMCPYIDFFADNIFIMRVDPLITPTQFHCELQQVIEQEGITSVVVPSLSPLYEDFYDEEAQSRKERFEEVLHMAKVRLFYGED